MRPPRAKIESRARGKLIPGCSFHNRAVSRARMEIDQTTYRKDTIHPPRWGYQARGNVAPSSIIIHTTSNKRATQFQTEAVYLRDSKDVSSHFLISKSGEVIQFLAPLPWQAWHAGNCLPAYLNARSIGIEHHVSVGERWTAVQHAACTWLVRQLMAEFSITLPLIETHRAVALPKGRKQDPAGWSDDAFYQWRTALVAYNPARYRVKHILISQRAEGGAPYAGELAVGDVVEIDMTYPSGMAHLRDGRGFVLLADLEPFGMGVL